MSDSRAVPDFDTPRTLGGYALNQVYCEDALTFLKGLPEESVDCIITDPPYGLGGRGFKVDRAMRRTDNNHQRGGTYRAIDEQWDLSVPLDWLDQVERILKDSGSIVIFAGRKSVYQFAAECLNRDWLLVNDVTWVKRNPTPCFTGRQMTMATERMLWFCPTGTRWTYNANAAREMNCGVNFQDVWYFGVDQGINRIHPAQKPLDLMERCTELFTNPTDVIVDPFAGSGTTGAAAIKLGRHFLGCDISAEYVALANKRLAMPYTPQMFDFTQEEHS